jgi:predicted membrane protein
MLLQAKVSKLKTNLTLVLLWTVSICVIAGCSLKDMDWPSREVLESPFFQALNV